MLICKWESSTETIWFGLLDTKCQSPDRSSDWDAEVQNLSRPSAIWEAFSCFLFILPGRKLPSGWYDLTLLSFVIFWDDVFLQGFP